MLALHSAPSLPLPALGCSSPNRVGARNLSIWIPPPKGPQGGGEGRQGPKPPTGPTHPAPAPPHRPPGSLQWAAVSLHSSWGCCSSSAPETTLSPCSTTTLPPYRSLSSSSLRTLPWPGSTGPRSKGDMGRGCDRRRGLSCYMPPESAVFPGLLLSGTGHHSQPVRAQRALRDLGLERGHDYPRPLGW